MLAIVHAHTMHTHTHARTHMHTHTHTRAHTHTHIRIPSQVANTPVLVLDCENEFETNKENTQILLDKVRQVQISTPLPKATVIKLSVSQMFEGFPGMTVWERTQVSPRPRRVWERH